MDAPFGNSISNSERVKRLFALVDSNDALAILINADPDAMASAMALKRLFWRRIRRIDIYRINKIDRADNLAFVKMLDVSQQHISRLKKSDYNKWAIVDSQPHHNPAFRNIDFNFIIDHHPLDGRLKADFIDVRPNFGANATILTEYLKTTGIKPSPRLATMLFYGIKSDTNNFVRATISNDINAFRYLYGLANLNIVKKIETSEIRKDSLTDLKKAMDNTVFYKQTAFVHMGRVKTADTLVIVADFLLKLAEATWSIVSGIEGSKLVVIFRNAGFRRNAGKMAADLFGEMGSAGGHKGAARAEVPLANIDAKLRSESDYRDFLLGLIKQAHRAKPG
jgi:nanoRNase/pAp phosphatase (c-di-AMP/oligoRNAs hydrolase)